MKVLKIDLSADFDFLELHTFADWHIGDVACDMNLIKSEIEAVSSKPNAYVILNGDLINNATKASVSDLYSEMMSPHEQIDRVTELLLPIKDRVLMVTDGNHEARSWRDDGISISGIIADRLGCRERYCREGGILFVRFGRQSSGHKYSDGNVRMMAYSIYCSHGSGGGRKEGAKAIRLADMASIIDADIYIHSHTHLPMIMKNSFYRVSPTNSSVGIVEKLFVNTAAKLDYGGYGQRGEFKPSSKANPIVILNGSHREMKAKL